jgi:uncharacterized protein YbcI
MHGHDTARHRLFLWVAAGVPRAGHDEKGADMAAYQESPAGDHNAGPLSASISNAIVHLHREYLGRGPTKARTSIRDDTVVVVMSDTLTKAERSLVADGKSDEVLQTRHSLQRTMRADMVSAVEQLTGRAVMALMSANHIDPDLACEVFILEPETQPAPVEAVRSLP